MKVLHLPTTVGGNPQQLSSSLKLFGVKSESWTLSKNYFGYSADRVIFGEANSRLIKELKRLWAFRYVFGKYDVVHFNFGSTLFMPAAYWCPKSSVLRNILRFFYAAYSDIMQQLELHILRWRQIAIFVHYQGDDARQGEFCLRHFAITAATEVGEEYYNAISDLHKQKQIKRMEKYSNKIYALNPDLLYVLPKKTQFIPYCHISLNEWTPVYNQREDRPLKIGHAPSHRKAKGTQYLLDALETLKAQGYHFDLVLVEGMNNVEARKCYEQIDVLVDQLFTGWYGGVAVEAMALGKPVLVYIREEDLHFIPDAMRHDLPFFNVTPYTIEKELRKVLEMPREDIYELGRKSRAFVEKWHDPIAIAKQIMEDYEKVLIKPRKRQSKN